MRGGVAIAGAVAITFIGDHSAARGLIVFAAFAALTALAFLIEGVRQQRDRSAAAGDATDALLGGLALIAAAVALLVSTLVPAPSSWAFAAVVAGWAGASGAVELIASVRRHPTDRVPARDRRFVGIASGALALILLAVPSDYALPYSVADHGVEQAMVLTSSIIVVGCFGCYAAIAGVRLVIAGLPVPGAQS